MNTERKGMVRIGDFENISGNPIEVANTIKTLIDKWGDDNDNIDFEEIKPIIPSKEKLINK